MSTQGKGEKNITRAEKRMAINKQKKSLSVGVGGEGGMGGTKNRKKSKMGRSGGGEEATTNR